MHRELCMSGQGWRVLAQRRDLIKLRSSQLNLLGLGKVSEWKDLLAGKLAPGEQGGQGKKVPAMPTSSWVADI